MTVSLCIRQRSKRKYDSVRVEELDWSAGRQVLIPAEHLWCDFKCRPWAKNSSPNTNDLYIHHMDKSTGTPPSLEEKKALLNLQTKKLIYLNFLFLPLLQQFWRVWNYCTHMYKSLVFGACLFCRPVKFFNTDWIIISLWSLSYTQRHCHVRIEKGPNCCYKIRSTQFPRISLCLKIKVCTHGND